MIIYKLPCLIVFYCCHTHSLSTSLSEDIPICRCGHWVCQRCHPPLMTELLSLCSKLILCLERGDLEVIPSLAWEWGLWKTWRENTQRLYGRYGICTGTWRARRVWASTDGQLMGGEGVPVKQRQGGMGAPVSTVKSQGSTVGYMKVTHRIKCPKDGFKEWEERQRYL